MFLLFLTFFTAAPKLVLYVTANLTDLAFSVCKINQKDLKIWKTILLILTDVLHMSQQMGRAAAQNSSPGKTADRR